MDITDVVKFISDNYTYFIFILLLILIIYASMFLLKDKKMKTPHGKNYAAIRMLYGSPEKIGESYLWKPKKDILEYIILDKEDAEYPVEIGANGMYDKITYVGDDMVKKTEWTKVIRGKDFEAMRRRHINQEYN